MTALIRIWSRGAAGLAGAVLLVLLSACAGGNTRVPSEVQITQAGQQVISRRIARRAQAQQPPLTRAALATVKVPATEVRVEVSDSLSYVFRDRTLQNGGPVEIWRSLDGAQIAMRNGVIISTRGIGGDLMSAQFPRRSGVAGPAKGGVHQLRVHDGINGEAVITLRCDLVDLGYEPVDIVGLRYSTRHLQQRCEGPENALNGVVVNDYWIDSNRPIIWQSRQWAGPSVGYLNLRRLVE